MAEEQFENKKAEQFAKNTKNIASNIEKSTTRLKELAKINKTVGEGFYQFADASKAVTNSLRENEDLQQRIQSGQIDLNRAKEVQADLAEKALKAERSAIHLSKQLLGSKSKLTKAQKAFVNAQIAGVKASGRSSSQMLSSAVKDAAKGNSFVTKSFDGVGRAFKKIGFKDAGKGFKDMAQQSRKAAVSGGGFIKQMGGGLGVMKKMTKFSPFGLISSIISALFKKLLQVNQEVTLLGRGLGISGTRAREVRHHFVNVANEVKRAGVEVQEVLKAQGDLNNALGTSVTMIHGDIIGGMAVLVERTKLSAEAAVGFGRAALASGKSVSYVADQIREGALAQEGQLGVNLDINKVMETTGKIGGETRAIFFDNFELMGKTVARAQSLGRSLQEVNTQSKSMLNFHTSIEKEMEAELFLGKQLNLDRARMAAMTGDLATFQEEIVQQAGDFLEFSKMNAFQRQKLADALGMSVDSLSDMLLKTTELDRLEGSIEGRTLEQLKQRQEQLSLQEAFNAALKRFQNMFTNIMAKLEDTKIFGYDLSDLTRVTDETVGKLRGGQTELSNYNPVGGATAPEFKSLTAEDFTIRTHPKDTLIMAGGTQLGNNNDMSVEHLKELISVSKTNRTFEYSGFAAVKEAGHYGTKFS